MVVAAKDDWHPSIGQRDQQVVAVTQPVGVADQGCDVVERDGTHDLASVGDG
jgi:hypothetical protein